VSHESPGQRRCVRDWGKQFASCNSPHPPFVSCSYGWTLRLTGRSKSMVLQPEKWEKASCVNGSKRPSGVYRYRGCGVYLMQWLNSLYRASGNSGNGLCHLSVAQTGKMEYGTRIKWTNQSSAFRSAFGSCLKFSALADLRR
jgi:hypothetical protein